VSPLRSTVGRSNSVIFDHGLEVDVHSLDSGQCLCGRIGCETLDELEFVGDDAALLMSVLAHDLLGNISSTIRTAALIASMASSTTD